MMKFFELPFHSPPAFDERDEYKKKLANVSVEKVLNELEIRKILRDCLEPKNFLLREERSISGIDGHPFDLIAGDQETLTLIGFEIKGDGDAYTLLPSQIDSYMFGCDYTFLVVHKKKSPEYLPRGIGVLRVFDDGSMTVEVWPKMIHWTEVATESERDLLFSANGFGGNADKVMSYLDIIEGVRRNILFNRFFAERDYMQRSYKKFWPFTEEQKVIMMGFNLPSQVKLLERDLLGLERRFLTVKQTFLKGKAYAEK